MSTCCLICFEEIACDDVYKMECSHLAHKTCILGWVCQQLVSSNGVCASCHTCRLVLSPDSLTDLLQHNHETVHFEDELYATSTLRSQLIHHAICNTTRREVQMAAPPGHFEVCDHLECVGGIWRDSGSKPFTVCAYCRHPPRYRQNRASREWQKPWFNLGIPLSHVTCVFTIGVLANITGMWLLSFG